MPQVDGAPRINGLARAGYARRVAQPRHASSSASVVHAKHAHRPSRTTSPRCRTQRPAEKAWFAVITNANPVRTPGPPATAKAGQRPSPEQRVAAAVATMYRTEVAVQQIRAARNVRRIHHASAPCAVPSHATPRHAHAANLQPLIRHPLVFTTARRTGDREKVGRQRTTARQRRRPSPPRPSPFAHRTPENSSRLPPLTHPERAALPMLLSTPAFFNAHSAR